MENNEASAAPAIKWYHYAEAFFAGFFLANAAPHFIHGISGDAFPTPFANPPGKGLSSPAINVLWACFNLLAGFLLLKASKASYKNEKILLLLLFIGIFACAIMLSIWFQDKMKA